MQILSQFASLLKWDENYTIFAKTGTSFGYFISKLKLTGQTLLVVCETDNTARAVYDELGFFGVKSRLFVSLELMPYSKMPPQPENNGQRISTLFSLLENKEGIYICSLQSLIEPVLPKEVLKKNYLYLIEGEDVSFSNLAKSLIELGYEKVENVETMGEFSVKGGVLDVFSPNYSNPLRIEFFGDTVESLRFFNPETQRSVEKTAECIILPAKNFILKDEYVKEALENLKSYGDAHNVPKRIRDQLSETLANGMYFAGIDFFLPVLYGKRSSILDYFDNLKTVKYFPEQFGKTIETILENINKGFYYHTERGEFVLKPEELFCFENYEVLKKPAFITFSAFPETKEFILLDFEEVKEFEELKISQQTDTDSSRTTFQPVEALKNILKEKRQFFKTLIVTSKRHQCEKLKELFALNAIECNGIVKDFQEFEKKSTRGSLYLTAGKPIFGFKSLSDAVFVITEEEIFGIKGKKKEVRKKSISESISTIYELKEGDLAVHVDHGVGIFRGLKQVSVLGKVGEYIELEYADNGKLFVSVDKINLIQKYIASEDYVAKIDRLGEKRWQKVKKKAKEDIKKWAEEIVKTEALRRTKEGFAFPVNTAHLDEFAATFDYEETEDQRRAIEETLADMEEKKPMDRIICGDVGFGKTEVAIRAAFVACEAKKQVAFVAPTTILVEQHYEVFKRRFEPFGYRVEMLSRFVEPKKQKNIVEQLKNGDVNIIIGTHRLFGKDINFKDLGLLIIDEEHKFGVAHKEKLKKLKAEVDVLTLTATPIPRTMHMSLSGLKSISIIASPPEGRLSIRTYVTKFSEEIIKEAVEREIQRGGQVFFIHNRIKSIFTIKRFLEKLLPYVDITVAHGRMDEEELKEVMDEFKKGNSQVLLCTAIVESGLDIPNANTIIVNRADKFGIADLYQLRGRVGRSSRRAYAYFLIPSFESITKDALKRLRVIQELEELGAGFRLAIHDLEIRGAGDLLGKKQSGHINEIGLELFMQLLDEAIRELRYETGEMKPEKIIETEINLPFPAYIPEHYIKSSRERLDYYKKIFATKVLSELDGVEEEMYDRFGKAPVEAKNFLYQRFLELTLASVGVNRLSFQNNSLIFTFDYSFVPPKSVILDMSKKGLNVKYAPPDKLYVTLASKVFDITELKKVLHVFLESVNIKH